MRCAAAQQQCAAFVSLRCIRAHSGASPFWQDVRQGCVEGRIGSIWCLEASSIVGLQSACLPTLLLGHSLWPPGGEHASAACSWFACCGTLLCNSLACGDVTGHPVSVQFTCLVLLHKASSSSEHMYSGEPHTNTLETAWRAPMMRRPRCGAAPPARDACSGSSYVQESNEKKNRAGRCRKSSTTKTWPKMPYALLLDQH